MENIIVTEYSEEMQQSYMDYSMSVITSRAIPDIRDGLKPVQRRVLYDMSELRLLSDRPHRKSARIVGDTMGKYHPHGDSSIYETLVVLTQTWKKSMPLIDGHGNFGSIEGDGAAAMRYTEAKLMKFTEEVYLKDLDKTVNFVSNYDETEKEPEVLPVRIPNILINGAEGIAVGMSTSIAPHNLSEVCDACIAYVKNRDISLKKLMEIMPGPDFPTGGIIANKKDLYDIYESGSGKLKIRGRIEMELGRKKADKDKLIITEIPYTMVGSGINKFLQDIANLVETRKLPEVVDISNQSDKNGTRIVLELRKDADIDRIKNVLYKKTKFEDSLGINMLAIVNSRPETLGLKNILSHFLEFQYTNNTNKYNILLAKELEKKEIQEGLIKASDCIDLIIAILRGAKTLNQAKLCLTKGETKDIKFKTKSLENDAKKLAFTQNQAQAILDMRLYKLIGLEIEALLKEHKNTLANIEEYQNILKSKEKMDALIINDLKKIKKDYATKRLTGIEDAKEAVYEEVEQKAEEVVLLIDRFGYAKLVDRSTYQRNAESIETEYKYKLEALNNEKVVVFSDIGYMHQIKLKDLPVFKLKDKGIPLDNICKFDTSKEEALFIEISSKLEGKELIFATAQGLVKKTAYEEFITNVRQTQAIKLNDEDRLAAVKVLDENTGYIIAVSDANYVLKFPIDEVALMKKTAKGEKLMKLGKGELIYNIYKDGEEDIKDCKGNVIDKDKLKDSHRADRGKIYNK